MIAGAPTVPAYCLPRFLEEAAPGLRMMSPPWMMAEAALVPACLGLPG
jgi:hypothetical protein